MLNLLLFAKGHNLLLVRSMLRISFSRMAYFFAGNLGRTLYALEALLLLTLPLLLMLLKLAEDDTDGDRTIRS